MSKTKSRAVPTYTVTQAQTRNGKTWRVTRVGAKRFAAAGYRTQQDAVRRGEELATRAGGQLIVCRADGQELRRRQYY